VLARSAGKTHPAQDAAQGGHVYADDPVVQPIYAATSAWCVRDLDCGDG
jgi:hypothetical protein